MAAYEISEGEWVESYDGISKVIFVSRFYVEEYTELVSGGNKGIGAPLNTVVVYKRLCDFSGEIRKGKIISSCDITLCSKLSDESVKILSKVESSNSDALKRLDKLEIKKPLKHDIVCWTSLPEQKVVEVKNIVDKYFSSELSSEFDFSDVNEKVASVAKIKSLFDHSYKRTSNNLCLILRNDNFVVRRKRAVFTGILTIIK